MEFALRNGAAIEFGGVPSQPYLLHSQPIEILSPSKRIPSRKRQRNVEETTAIPFERLAKSLPATKAKWEENTTNAHRFYNCALSFPHFLGEAPIPYKQTPGGDGFGIGIVRNSSPNGSDFSHSSSLSLSSIDHKDPSKDDVINVCLQEMSQFLSELQQPNPETDPITDGDAIMKKLQIIANSQSTPLTSSFESSSVPPAHKQHERTTSEQQSLVDSQWMYTSTLTLPAKPPAITIIRQPPQFHRARYEKEGNEGAKGWLKNEDREPVAIQLENMAYEIGDITVTIIVLTVKGFLHPYIYPTCFGRGMSAEWKKDEEERSVSVVLRATEEYRKDLTYLGIKRNKLEGIDLSLHTKDELSNFCLMFVTSVPSLSGSFTCLTSTTQFVRVLCPSTFTKRRKKSKSAMDEIQ